MGYKYNKKNLSIGQAWTDDKGFKHPSNWASSWSQDDLKKWGVTFEKDVDTSYDDRFYWSKDNEKNLEDINVVDKDGKAVIDSITGKQLITEGLKTYWIQQTKLKGNNLLKSTDWYVTRKYETDTAIPSDITKYREEVRTATKTIEDKINACKKLNDFKKLFDIPVDKDGKITGKPPINDYPDEV